MCGLAGFMKNPESFSPEQGELALRKMMASLSSRGPDSGGLWINPQAGLALGHRRLSILDLSPLGRQPMRTSCGRYTIVYNGEIYNYLFVKKNLEEKNISFQGHSDTEVLLAAFQTWGVEKTCSLIRGMYAFALWDDQTQTLTLGRDPLGIKPLYWGRQKDSLFFGSHSQSIRVHPAWESRLCSQALEAYVTYGYVPAPLAIDEEMQKVKPGTFLVFGKDRSLLQEIQFWNGLSVAQEGIQERNRWPLSDTETCFRLKSLLQETVNSHMEADVPLGAFLSGGIDSSLVVASMQSQRTQPVQTFSIGFTNPDFDEAPYARAIAHHLGTDHHEVYLTPQDVMTFIPRLPEWYDEPFADSSQLPTFLVSQKARQKVTVSLSGDGGDELFGGYNRYRVAPSGEAFLTYIPLKLRAWLKARVSKGRPLSKFLKIPQWDQKLQKIGKILDAETDLDLYKRLLTFWDSSSLLREKGGSFHPDWETSWRLLPTFLDRMQVSDMLGYLPDDILTKVDRASMAVGLEARVPFLDPEIVRFAWSLPQHFKQRGGVGKWILRRVLETYMPASLFERPKMGFAIPLGEWLRGPLKSWAESLLFAASEEESPFRTDVLQKTWTCHQEGLQDWGSHLWVSLAFQQWHASRKDQKEKNETLYREQLSLPLQEIHETGCLLKFFG